MEGGASRPRVLIVGGGFAGLSAARRLKRVACDVVVLDRCNHHVFQPLLYQIATAALSPADIAEPIRSILRNQQNAQVLLGEAHSVDVNNRRIAWDGGDIAYDWLVLAAGATHAYFGNDQWADRAPGLKTVDDALEIRRRILLAFEAAELEEDVEARRAQLTFVVVGAGPTGVEMAGALREIAAQTIPDDFRRVDTATARILLVEGQDRVLPAMSETASRKALASLEKLGVEVRLNTYVTRIDDEDVWAGDECIPAANVIWAAGVQAAPFIGDVGVPLDPQGRVRVEPDCSLPGYPQAFAVGDLAHLVDPGSGLPVPGVAQGALQMGAFVGDVIRSEIESGGAAERPEFRYNDKGSMATIGRARAVADIGARTVSGFPAWILWSLIHVAFLIGFRNKLLVMVNWAWQWLVQARGARLITGSRPVDVERGVDLS